MCFESLTEELEKAEHDVGNTEMHIKHTLTNIKPGGESAKHRALAQKYDLKTARELIVKRTE